MHALTFFIEILFLGIFSTAISWKYFSDEGVIFSKYNPDRLYASVLLVFDFEKFIMIVFFFDDPIVYLIFSKKHFDFNVFFIAFYTMLEIF